MLSVTEIKQICFLISDPCSNGHSVSHQGYTSVLVFVDFLGVQLLLCLARLAPFKADVCGLHKNAEALAANQTKYVVVIDSYTA